MSIPFDTGAGTSATAKTTVSDEDLNAAAKQSNTTPSYSVGHLSYPEDLLNVPDYGGNYVMFFINERSESKINQKNDYVLQDVDPAVGRAVNGAGFSNIAVLGSSFLTGAGAGGLIGGLISGGGGGVTKGAAALGGVSAATSGSLGTLDGLNLKALGKDFTKPMKRMKHAIALHMPNNFAIRSGAQYEEAETFMAQAFMQSVDVIADGATNLAKGIAEGLSLIHI